MKFVAILFGCALAIQAQEDAQKRIEVKVQDAMVSIGGLSGLQVLSGHLLDSNPVKGQPYSAEAVNETTQTLADGNRIVNRSSSMLYRDSEGRERREETIAKLGNWSVEGTPAKMILISDPVAKASFSLDEKSRTATKMPMAGGLPKGGAGMQTFAYSRSEQGVSVAGLPGESHVFKFETRVDGPSSPSKTEKLGSQTIEGVVADGIRTTTTIPAGKVGNERDINIVDERWYSPELQVTVKSTHSDPRMGETTYRLTNISRAEPARTLFEVPSDYSLNDLPAVKRVIHKDDN